MCMFSGIENSQLAMCSVPPSGSGLYWEWSLCTHRCGPELGVEWKILFEEVLGKFFAQCLELSS